MDGNGLYPGAQEIADAMHRLLERSAVDMAFRRRLLTDPRATLAEALGREISPSFDIRFIENTADVTIVLPDPIAPVDRLDEIDLEYVAGGRTAIRLTAALLCDRLGVS